MTIEYRNQVIEKMAHYLNTESRMGNFIFYKKLVQGMLFETAELAIVNRSEKISCGTSEVRAINTGWDLCKTYVENNNFVKEVKE